MALPEQAAAAVLKARSTLLDGAGAAVAADIRNRVRSRQDLAVPDEVGSPTKGTTPLARARASGRKGPPRIDTGEMINSVRSISAGPTVREVAVFGDREQVAVYQHFGTLRRGVRKRQQREVRAGLRRRVATPALPGARGSGLTHIPPRPFIGVGAGALGKIRQVAEQVQATLVRDLDGIKLPPLTIRMSV